MNIPENITEFLYWIKERTELFWSIDPKTSSNDFVCEDWIYGAKWIGLSKDEIDEIEIKYSVKFTFEHHEFLRVLHTIDRKEKIEYSETFDKNSKTIVEEIPFFYNWLNDEKEIREIIKWSFETIYQDVIGTNRVWLKSWGKRPKSEIEIKNIFTSWHQKTPKLIPIRGNRFVISEPNLQFNPVLSIWGSDIIVYGWNLRSYLLNELQEHLDIQENIYDEEDKCYYPELINEVQTIFDEDYKFDKNKDIPYWKELILIWNSGWTSFGLKYPGQEDNNPYRIMKTYVPDGEENEQKTFNSF